MKADAAHVLHMRTRSREQSAVSFQGLRCGADMIVEYEGHPSSPPPKTASVSGNPLTARECGAPGRRHCAIRSSLQSVSNHGAHIRRGALRRTVRYYGDAVAIAMFTGFT